MKPVAAFFYGLFMDADLLRGKGLRVQDSRMARLDDCRLRIGARATLVPARGASVYGMLMQMPAEDLQKLYADPSVSAYIPQSVEVVLNDGVRVAASCYVLPNCVQDFLVNRRKHPAHSKNSSENKSVAGARYHQRYEASIQHQSLLAKSVPQFIDRVKHPRPADQPMFKVTLPRKIKQHYSQQDRQDPLSRHTRNRHYNSQHD